MPPSWRSDWHDRCALGAIEHSPQLVDAFERSGFSACSGPLPLTALETLIAFEAYRRVCPTPINSLGAWARALHSTFRNPGERRINSWHSATLSTYSTSSLRTPTAASTSR